MTTVTFLTCKRHQMAEIQVNGEQLYVGNYWDYHPGCHGIPYLCTPESHPVLAYVKPNWRGPRALLSEVVRILKEQGHAVAVEEGPYVNEWC
jgi:hypothetical protein